MSLTRRVKEEARRLGFQLVGVTSPDPPPHLEIYDRWLEGGLHGEMTYLDTNRARERRADPRLILPDCMSILVLGMRYPAAGDDAREDGDGSAARELPGAPIGRVASYAWGDDYHEILAVKLRALVAFIESTVGFPVPNRWYTDTGPILEREMAQRAGLGWIGKNTCLIHPTSGSYYLLAEVLLGLELQPDPPFAADHCGSCTRCLEACPTGCILPDRTIDANRCISYLTIELKGPIPPSLRPVMGDWVFGCDVCQEVCPWNVRFAHPVGAAGWQGDQAFAPRRGVPRPDLVEEINLTPEAFNRKFKRSPVKRARRRGYLRNVAVALGNAGDPRSIPVLKKALLEDPEPLVRSHAAWALGEIGVESAFQALREALLSEKDAEVLREIEAALEGLGAA